MEQLKKCPFCGGENIRVYDCGTLSEPCWVVECLHCKVSASDYWDEDVAITAWNTRKPMERYEELERKLQSVYGECDGLLEKVVEGLVKHEGAEFEKPMKARLLTDEDVDKWDRLKGAKERILERLEIIGDIERDVMGGRSSGRTFASGFTYGIESAIEIVKEEGGV